MTLLMKAAFKGQQSVCSFLLARGADPNIRQASSGVRWDIQQPIFLTSLQFTALMLAAVSGLTSSFIHQRQVRLTSPGSAQCVDVLLAKGAQKSCMSTQGRTAEQMAIFVGLSCDSLSEGEI
jgi:ankyrin repeat protein